MRRFIVEFDVFVDVVAVYHSDENQYMPEEVLLDEYYIVDTVTGKRHKLSAKPTIDVMLQLDDVWEELDMLAFTASQEAQLCMADEDDLPF